MTRTQIIEQLFTGKNFNDCISKMEPEHLRDDLKMEVIAIVCEWSEERIIGLHARKELDYFVVRVILNQIQSSSSPFHKKYRRALEEYDEQVDMGNYIRNGKGIAEAKHRKRVVEKALEMSCMNQPEDIESRQEREDMEDLALQEIDNLYWYNANLLKLYGEHGSYRALEAATGIPYVSCYHTIRKSIKQVKDIALCSITQL